jgi:hypothetical protein
MSRFYVTRKSLEEYQRAFGWCCIPSKVPKKTEITEKNVGSFTNLWFAEIEKLLHITKTMPTGWCDAYGASTLNSPSWFDKPDFPKYTRWLTKKLKEAIPILIRMRDNGELAKLARKDG